MALLQPTPDGPLSPHTERSHTNIARFAIGAALKFCPDTLPIGTDPARPCHAGLARLSDAKIICPVSHAERPLATSIGIDFGTSNTVVAVASPDGRVKTMRFAHGGDSLAVYASTLCFWQEQTGIARSLRAEGGPWAIAHFLEERTGLRFIQSVQDL